LMNKIKIFIVDDNFVARRGLRNFLQAENDFVIVGEASTGRSAIDWIRGNEADIVLMDVRMPDTDGIEATGEIFKLKPEIKALVLTVVEEQATILRALLAGAKGYLVYSRFSPEELIKAIRAVLEGSIVTIPSISPALLASIAEQLKTGEISDLEKMEPLTSREKDILGLISIGKTNLEIARTLEIQEKTVKNYINNIYGKLQLKSRYEAISYLLRQSLK